MGKLRFNGKYVFIISWILWAMLCVRFGFRIGIIGSDNGSSISTVLFAVIFCALIPSLLFFFKKTAL